MGHIGLLPQAVSKSHDYRVKGRTLLEEKKIINDTNTNFNCICSSKKRTKLIKFLKLKQLELVLVINVMDKYLLTEDLLGFFNKNAKFVKKYANINAFITQSYSKI